MSLRTFHVRDVRIEVDYALLTPQIETQLKNGAYEATEADALARLLRPDDVYLEVGAGLGFTSCLAARVIGDPARLHAYEANPILVPVIEQTWRANGAGGHLEAVLLGRGDGTANFHIARAFPASSTVVDYGKGTTIQAPRRDFVEELERTGATFVLMDIEGGEAELLAQPLPERVRVVVAELHPAVTGRTGMQALVRHLESQGFAVDAAASAGKVFALERRQGTPARPGAARAAPRLIGAPVAASGPTGAVPPGRVASKARLAKLAAKAARRMDVREPGVPAGAAAPDAAKAEKLARKRAEKQAQKQAQKQAAKLARKQAGQPGGQPADGPAAKQARQEKRKESRNPAGKQAAPAPDPAA